MYDRIVSFSSEIAYEAGKILLGGFRSRDTEVSYKSRTDLVTNIDRESEEYLYNSIRRKFPGHTVIAEEGSRHDTGKDYIWYVDPLDATNNFAHGIPYFCISIGVFSIELKRVITGVVYDPFHDELFGTAYGSGSTLNGNEISVSETGELGISVVATGFPYDRETHAKNNLIQFNKVMPAVQGIRRLGSAALDLCYVSCGRFDGYWEPMLRPWDMAAGSLIVEEAGGRVTRYNGETFDPEFPEIAASNGKIHDELLGLL
jgi:myo-inositol-1(or 4)-monophosphatase